MCFSLYIYNLSYSLYYLKEGYIRSIIGVIKGDTVHICMYKSRLCMCASMRVLTDTGVNIYSSKMVLMVYTTSFRASQTRVPLEDTPES